MTPQRLSDVLTGVTGGTGTVSGGGRFARATVDVPVAGWLAAVRAARDDDRSRLDFFDWLGAVDEQERGYTVLLHAWSTPLRHGALLRTLVPRDQAVLDSVVPVYPGAAWPEREAHEMFGVRFAGHPGGLRPLLLPAQFEGYPLRKDFVLASRVAKPWPGAKEPGEPGAGRRAPLRPPGVPAPGQWGPAAP